MRKLNIITIFLLGLFTSCEDIIKLDLRSSDPQIVIEGVVTTQPGPYFVKISKSTDFYEPGIYPPVTGALVEITDNAGNNEILTEVSEGSYIAQSITGQSGRVYTLNVTIDTEEYSAESVMVNVVEIDSLRLEFFSGTDFRDGGYYLHCFFTDPPETGNNYRIITYVNGEMDKTIFLVDDKFINGNSVDYYIYNVAYQPGDTALVQLISVDLNVYNYYMTLLSVINQPGGGSPANPANPNSNLTNGALGYFGALAIDRDTLIIK